jgi:hypothetical protein
MMKVDPFPSASRSDGPPCRATIFLKKTVYLNPFWLLAAESDQDITYLPPG